MTIVESLPSILIEPPAVDPLATDASPPPPHGPERPPAQRWFVPAHASLLLATAFTYLWGLGASGWANAYYSAATQAASSSWKAWFFGSFDASNAITVDKPPAALWVTGLSARLFGVSSWSILVPEALMGVATVALVVALVRRWFSPGPALLAGAAIALTPVAVLMFRFNNPDALLVLLLTAAAYAITRALERGRTAWVVAAGALVGFGFLAKMLQAFVLLPALALVYLVAAPTGLRRRLVQLVAMGAATFAAAGWWVAAVELWPTSSRPYIGGSQTNSVLELIFGYNGFGRLTGEQTGAVLGGGGTTGQWGPTGWLRMFNSSFGGQISWLLPAALVVLVAGLAATWRRPRTDRTRAALILWGTTLLVTGITFSLGKGIIHEYYTVALAPSIGALIGIGAHLGWKHRSSLVARVVVAATIAVTAWWSWVLLHRSPTWHTWLTPTIAVAAVAAVIGVLFAAQRARLAAVAAALTVGAALAGPAAYAVETAATPHTGALPTAGPAVVGARRSGPGGFARTDGTGAGVARPADGTRPTTGATGAGAPPAGGAAPTGMGGGGAAGGLLSASAPSAALVTALTTNASEYTWVAATVGANEAAGYQLATGLPVMAIGGFNGSDPAPTLTDFQKLVAEGRIHWFIPGGRMGNQLGGSDASASIATWVTTNYTATTVGGVTVYDLST